MTILAACSCTFSNFSISAEEQPSHTTEAYSNIGLIKVIYNFDSLSMPKVNLSFLSSPNFLQALLTISLMYTDHFKSSESVRTRDKYRKFAIQKEALHAKLCQMLLIDHKKQCNMIYPHQYS